MLKVVKKYAVACVIFILPMQYSIAVVKKSEIATSKSPIYLNLETGYSKSKNMKGTYGKNMGSSILVGAGIKYAIKDKIKLGVSFSQRAGYKFDTALSNRQCSQDFDIVTVLPNISYDILSVMNNKVTPFVELGAGISQVKAGNYTITNFSTLSTGDKKNNFTYSAMLGVAFKASNALDIAVGARHINFGKVTGGYNEKGRVKANEAILSLIINL